MKPITASFLAVLAFASIPGGCVFLLVDAEMAPAFVLGCVAVAAVTAVAAEAASRRGWVVGALLALVAVATLPVVAGGVTGGAVGLLAGGTDVAGSLKLGLSGAIFLYAPLFAASVIAWGVALGVRALWSRRLARAANVGRAADLGGAADGWARPVR